MPREYDLARLARYCQIILQKNQVLPPDETAANPHLYKSHLTLELPRLTIPASRRFFSHPPSLAYFAKSPLFDSHDETPTN
jgi:hypothetical protein